MSNYEIVIGLEVHVQLKTRTKIFCSCPVTFDAEPNTNICPVCCGYPGVLPVFNRRALELAVRVGLALNCRLNDFIYFERKNYFYPDLPKNYQISQYKRPLGEGGAVILSCGSKIGIERIHLEEDAGKLVHTENYSLVDLNRTGAVLLEIVSAPDITSPAQAYDYLSALKLILQYIGVSDCDMEKGILRCDANISLRKKGEKRLGVKVELKNMNTFRGVRDALSYEASRQEKAILNGEKIYQETMLWDTARAKTVVMRSKEEAHDYRYFPEPDLPNFSVTAAMVEEQKKQLPEMPPDKRKRFIVEYLLSEKETDILISVPALADFFEKAVSFYNQPKEVSNWVLGPMLEQVNNLKNGWEEVKISPKNFSKVVKYFKDGKLNNVSAKKVLSLSVTEDKDADSIIDELGLVQVSSVEDLAGFIEEAVKENPKAVDEYLSGKVQAVMFLVGQVMKKTKGKANPKVVKEVLEGRLKK